MELAFLPILVGPMAVIVFVIIAVLSLPFFIIYEYNYGPPDSFFYTEDDGRRFSKISAPT
jgi:hypothetical protein